MSDGLSHRSSVTGSTSTGAGNESFATGTSLPLALISPYRDELQRHTVDKLPNLPSHRYRYSVWHDLSKTHVRGSQLRAPRIRAGPTEKEEFFYKLKDENSRSIHHTRMGKQRRNYQDETENWEQAVFCNLSYQDMGHKYQRECLVRVLKRLIIAEEINIIDNELVNLSSVTFPKCVHLNASQNYVPSFKKLPSMPKIKILDLEDNYIRDLDGINLLSKTPLESLILRGNPLSFTLNYRQRVLQRLPGLRMLDGLPRIRDDKQWEKDQKDQGEPDPEDNPGKSKFCGIS